MIIRHNGRALDPADFRRGFGLLGFRIRVAYWLRNQLDAFITRAVVRLAGEQLEERRAPRRLLHDLIPPEHVAMEDRTRARYSEGRKNADEGGPMRPVPLEEGLRATFAAADVGHDRSTRYANGRSHRSYEADD